MAQHIENLRKSEQLVRTCDHLIYTTFPLVKDKKLLLKIMVEIKNAIALSINAILQYEYLYKRISLSHNPSINFQTFKEKSSKRYSISQEEIKQIEKLFDVVQKHKQSPFEFSKNGEIYILSEQMEKISINVEKIKQFLNLSKNILNKTKIQFLRKV